MLLGTYPGVLSPKHRTAIPKSFREHLGDQIVITKWYESCLVITSAEAWKALLTRITGFNTMITQSVRDTDRFLLASAYEAKTDAQGRVVLPQSLVSFASLSNEIVFLGLGDRIEVWDKAIWDKKEQDLSHSAESVLEQLARETTHA
jgi:MraZ protein